MFRGGKAIGKALEKGTHLFCAHGSRENMRIFFT